MAEISLLPVVVGGLLTMGGGVVGFVGSVILGVMQNQREKQKRRADKFEEFLSAVYEYEHWMDTQKNIRCYGENLPLGISPLAKAEAIAAVYFPSCLKKIKELELPSQAYSTWMAKSGMKRIEGKISELNDGFNEVYQPFYYSLSAVLDQARKIAPSL
jgi:hypothetical protein